MGLMGGISSVEKLTHFMSNEILLKKSNEK